VRQRLLAEANTRGLTLGSLDDLLREQLGNLIRNLTEQVDTAIPAVLTGHFTVQGAQLGSERGIMLGRDVAVPVSTLTDPVWDYVAMGHIHYHQDMNPGHQPPVVYSGSIERIDFGEEGAPKGFCWVELARNETTYQFVEVAARVFETIKVDCRTTADPTAAVLKAIKKRNLGDAVVRVNIQTSPETDTLIRQREVEQALQESGCAFIAAVNREIEYPVRSRLGVERPEGLSPLELLDRYFVSKDISADRAAILREYAENLFEEGAMFEG
jgi:exonuclease SbcD